MNSTKNNLTGYQLSDDANGCWKATTEREARRAYKEKFGDSARSFEQFSFTGCAVKTKAGVLISNLGGIIISHEA